MLHISKGASVQALYRNGEKRAYLISNFILASAERAYTENKLTEENSPIVIYLFPTIV